MLAEGEANRASRGAEGGVGQRVMAKWGHGDPRWIVEERADATNVNNWHWWGLISVC